MGIYREKTAHGVRLGNVENGRTTMGVDARMLVKLATPIDDAALVDAAYKLAEAMGHRSSVFWLSADDAIAKGEKRRALNRLVNDDEGDYRACGIGDFSGAWLWVSLWGRYYGDGYERGDLWAYIAIAEWLERNFTSCTVYYGGDSGDRIELFGKSAREELIAHWSYVGGRPYFAHEGGEGFMAPKRHPLQPTCPLCERLATQYGTGQQFASWTCDGCSRHWVWIGGEVKAFKASREFDSFKAASEMREALVGATKDS